MLSLLLTKVYANVPTLIQEAKPFVNFTKEKAIAMNTTDLLNICQTLKAWPNAKVNLLKGCSSDMNATLIVATEVCGNSTLVNQTKLVGNTNVVNPCTAAMAGVCACACS